MGQPALRFAAAAAAATCLAIVVSGVAPLAQTGKPAAPPQQTPVFRTATNLVQVDAYPTRDGRIIEGLTAKDFQVLEDGKPQAIESFEFIRIEPNTPEAMRRDPNTQEEGNRLAADPRNRVFVLYLDHYHGSLSGSYSVRGPIVTMLNRLLTPDDLFGIATPLMQPRELVLGRQTTTIEDQLTRHWTWGLQSGAVSLEPGEEGLVRCYGEAVALAVTARTREERTLESLGQFVNYLGSLREARKVLIVFSRGWTLFEPDPGGMNQLLSPEKAGRPAVGVTSGGKLSTSPPNQPGMADWNWCAAEVSRAFMLDNRKRFRELIDEANRANVAFYPVNVDGVSSGERGESLRTLAENTDGLVSMTNDFNAGLRRIADDVSAYYLLGYYSTNAKADGNYRRIDVKVASPGARVKARRGYVSAAADSRPPGAEAAGKPALAPEMTDALEVLARLRLTAELFTYGVADATGIDVVAELPAERMSAAAWQKGADVEVTVASGTGATSAATTARIDPGTRGVLVRVPRPVGAGPFRVNVRVSGADGVVLRDRLDVVDRTPKVTGRGGRLPGDAGGPVAAPAGGGLPVLADRTGACGVAGRGHARPARRPLAWN